MIYYYIFLTEIIFIFLFQHSKDTVNIAYSDSN